MHSCTRFVCYQKLVQNRTCTIASKLLVRYYGTSNLDRELWSCAIGLIDTSVSTMMMVVGHLGSGSLLFMVLGLSFVYLNEVLFYCVNQVWLVASLRVLKTTTSR